MNLTIKNLESCFKVASQSQQKYVAVVVRMEGFPSDEIIINNCDNFDAKLKYYKSAYDEKLNHKFSKGISIVGFTYGDSFKEIESDLIGLEG